MAAPWVAVAMYPRTDPKQWKSGGGQHTMSAGVRRILSPIWEPLFKIERWLKHAALGIAVVPDVNWMLTMSAGERLRGGRAIRSDGASETSDV